MRLPSQETRRINPDSPMWMGFADQQVAGSGPAPITTFQGNSSARFTTATSGSYFDNGSLQHFSHVIQDLAQFYGNDEPFSERVQYMFRSDPIPVLGNGDQFSNGGGPALPGAGHQRGGSDGSQPQYSQRRSASQSLAARGRSEDAAHGASLGAPAIFSRCRWNADPYSYGWYRI